MTKEIILKRMTILNDLQKELNVMKEQYKDMLENDPQYQAYEEEASKFREETKGKKEKAFDKSTYKSVLEEVKEKQREISENKEILSQELIDYYRANGTLEIEDPDGNIKKMKFSVKLVN